MTNQKCIISDCTSITPDSTEVHPSGANGLTISEMEVT